MDTTEESAGVEPLRSLFPELRDLPRQAKNRVPMPGLGAKNLKRLLPFLVPLIIFAIGFPLMFFVVALAVDKVPPDQAVTPGAVTQVVTANSLTGRGPEMLRFRYTVSGRKFNALTATPTVNNQSRSLKVGDRVIVQYLKADPTRCQIRQENNLNDIWPIFLALPIFIVVMLGSMVVPFVLPSVLAQFRARKLLLRGELTQGWIVFVKPVKAGFYNMPWGGEIQFRFEDSNGVLRTSKISTDNTWLVNQFAPETPVVVAYDPKKPERNVILEPFVG